MLAILLRTKRKRPISKNSYQGHYSVLKEESIVTLQPTSASGIWIDGTLGEAGHASYALSSYPSISLIGLDADPQMLQRAHTNLIPYAGRYQLVNQFFDDYFAHYPPNQAPPSTILLDLGISMFHYKGAARGFSYDDESSLDMRLNPSGESAYDLLLTKSESDLASIFWRYGEEKESRRIAKAIVHQRKSAPITSAKELSNLIKSVIKPKPTQYLHPAAKVFQALRIAVNHELSRLERMLPLAFSRLETNGKLGIITFHSLEDRIVKHFFKELTKSCQCPDNQLRCTCLGAYAKQISPKGITATPQEIAENPASRSARLRVIQKIRPYPKE
ncbi:16S rRNA (cytosine(1402)-N(4))-methyltransferase RsmH [Entomospira culicis]|uniref:Ribosomal RNA small subunit methyltransferase H n=1 Tax=Entomospira culicis TaxID=2719989 RepID=A0A968GGZ1_9SPIO|nr:16S rRNA (cytosine(1402)-N(4))-methyltransferase RsmH [Entomospira culicis]NIZ19449.1 16S rRNA (cytosine(1402)-N(4))-methyltransferase RsmH [Entomospira culicis]NIZ69646.1 16S rRNA (cytosine(1402)-N(4))-methyltransferase RsmH [Entomospira culicis]WDI36757.1 16S rRNA (cytosine(1402)-N(4))-methyltransferase RsmH [Entomospira culicis]WDI38386.1 16S rRNA (cytosine(1402)-N(4))-methyltransferase RsmH [Entomospira culicis]